MESAFFRQEELENTAHGVWFALEITARPCSEATGRSKSMLGRAYMLEPGFFVFGSTRKYRPAADFLDIPFEMIARACSAATGCSKSHRPSCSKLLLGRDREPSGARNHCSGVLRSHLAPEIAAQAGFLVFDRTFVFLRDSCRNHMTSNCALRRAVLCKTSQASSGAICRSSKEDLIICLVV